MPRSRANRNPLDRRADVFFENGSERRFNDWDPPLLVINDIFPIVVNPRARRCADFSPYGEQCCLEEHGSAGNHMTGNRLGKTSEWVNDGTIRAKVRPRAFVRLFEDE